MKEHLKNLLDTEDKVGDDFTMPFKVMLSDDITYPKWDKSGIRARNCNPKMKFCTATKIEIDRDKFISWLKQQRPIVRFDVRFRGNLHFLKMDTWGMK